MQISLKIYIKIYFWQFLSIVLNFLSFYIVIPKLTENPTLYGIYTVCIGLNMFLTYGDLGFISAAQKYASESFARNDIEEEVNVTAFACYMLWLVSLLFLLGIIYLSLYPHILIKNLGYDYVDIARYLLLIVGLSSQIIVFQRFLQITFGVRMKDFMYQKYNIVATLIKLLSVFIFFREGNNNIVGYFLFTQLINICFLSYVIYISYVNFKYPFKLFLKNFRYSKLYFYKTKKLAFSTLVLTISWVFYYELDTIVISKVWGIEQVAIYAVGFSMLSLCRTIFGAIFSPFSSRFNHFIGLQDIVGLKKIIKKIIYISFPVFVITVFTLVFFIKPLILSWVGFKYIESISIAQLLILYNIVGFVSYPVGILLVALEKNSTLIYLSILMPIVYWIIIFLCKDNIGIAGFGIAKLVIGVIMGIVYIWHLSLFLREKFLHYIVFYSLLTIEMVFVTSFLSNILQYFNSVNDKDTKLLLMTLILILLTIALSYLIYSLTVLIFNKYSERLILKNFLKNIL